MFDTLQVKGMVIQATPVGDFDKRIVILTKERGKITAFARGARRPNSPFLAGTRPFSFGTFTVMEGRDYYRVRQVDIENFFEEMSEDLEVAYYGFYFLEWADYYGREFVDGKDTLNLLYQTFRALLKPALPNSLVRCIFELKMLTINGEYPNPDGEDRHPSTVYALDYVIRAPIEKLYNFVVTPEVETEMRKILDQHIEKVIDRKFKSLEMYFSIAKI
ncbi:MAG: DNA repair protein RecO [Lachnospiraceae bacterium]|nr:DNA repair protein RecO [Lachnospiraceae bacterium]